MVESPHNMTKSQKNQTESSGSGNCNRIPPSAIFIDNAVSIVLCGLGIYHFTQPHQAWRSGIIELLCSMLLLTAAYRVSRAKAVVINLIVAVPIFSLGIRHLIHGGGWLSGITELFFAALLITAANIIHRYRES